MQEYPPKELKNRQNRIDMNELLPLEEDVMSIRYRDRNLLHLEDWDYKRPLHETKPEFTIGKN